MAVPLQRHKFTADEYQAMGRAGILDEDSRVELIEGEIVDMPPICSSQGGSVDRGARAFVLRFDDVAQVRVQGSIRLDRFNEPEPDLALLRRRDDFYASELPGPDDVLLIVEVADSSLARDRGVKLRLYARTGVPEVWLVDLQHQVVEVHREPRRGSYRLVSTLRPGQPIAPLAFPDRELDLAEFLG
jgi:Uma2 family endonuclease